jgi:predicted PurR-regulated permease PerM
MAAEKGTAGHPPEHDPTGQVGRPKDSVAPAAEDSARGTSQVKLSNLPWAITDDHDRRALPPWFRRAVVMVLALAIVARVASWAFGQLSSFWYTVFLAFFFGITMEPLVNRLARRGMRRGVGTILVMGGLIGATVIFFVVFGQLFAEQLAALISSIPEILAKVVDWVNERFGTQFNSDTILRDLGIETADLAKAAADLGVSLLGILGTAIGWVFSFFTILLFAFYFAADGPSFRRGVASWLPPNRQRTFLTVWDISTEKAGGYVISRGIMAIISAIFHATVFFIIDLPYWLPLGMWVGLVSQFIPTIGTYLAGALPVIIALVSSGWPQALVVLGAVVLYQQIENYFISPRVTRNTLEIHPAVAFGSVIVGGTLFGGVGALLAIPVVATIQSVISVYGRRYDLIAEFGTSDDASDLDRVDAAIRASDTGFPSGPGGGHAGHAGSARPPSA